LADHWVVLGDARQQLAGSTDAAHTNNGALATLGICFLDRIIIAGGEAVSFAERGLL
jgi:hypothetical protein